MRMEFVLLRIIIIISHHYGRSTKMIEILAQNKELAPAPVTQILLGEMNKERLLFLMLLNFLKKRDLLTLSIDGFNLEKTIWGFVHQKFIYPLYFL